MKIAYFSPFNPQKSGISAYSETLLPYLKKYCNIDLWVDGIQVSHSDLSTYKKINYSQNKDIRKKLHNYDLIVYNIGNNPEFHGNIYDVFLEYPGVVILHDFVLYYLVTGYYLYQKNDKKSYINEFYFNYGREGIDEVKKLLRSSNSLLLHSNVEEYPLIKRIISNSQGIIVHSNITKNKVIDMGYQSSKIAHINHINLSQSNIQFNKNEENRIRKKYSICPSDFVIASFGYIAPTKRNLESIEVINDLIESFPFSIKYLMVGEGNYIDNYLSDTIQKTGYIDINELEILIRLTDIVINLRNPSMGETSGTLIRAMNAGKPCIVSDIGWFSELPKETVFKITCDPLKEKKELEESLKLLIAEKQIRRIIGIKACEYIHHHHNPENVAKEMINFLRIL